MEYGILFLSCLMLSITIAGFAQSFLGFGYAIVALSILPFFIEIELAILIVSVSVVFPLVYMAWGNLGELDWKVLGLALSTAAVGMPIGLYVFVHLDPLWLMRGTGITIFLIASHGLLSRHHHNEERKTSYLWGMIAGFASGFLTGSVSIGGPPITAYAVSQPWSANKYRAFLFSFALIVCSYKVLGLFRANLLTQETISLSAIAIPFGLLGAWLGLQTAKRVDSQRFRKIVLVSLLFVSIGILLRKPKDKTEPQLTPVNKTISHHNAPTQAVLP